MYEYIVFSQRINILARRYGTSNLRVALKRQKKKKNEKIRSANGEIKYI